MEESDPVRLLSYRLWVRNYDSLDITNADLMVAMHVGVLVHRIFMPADLIIAL